MLDVSRRELKYLVTQEDVLTLGDRLSASMKSDIHNGRAGYRVRSLYFDTLFDSDFEDKVAGYDIRQKIRLRVYDPAGERVKLELKEKEGIFQRKRSLLLTRQEAEKMIREDYCFLMERPEPLAHWLYTFLELHCYRPKCIVEYDRIAFCREENNTRVTFDMNLRATETSFNLLSEDLIFYPVSSSWEVTMEVKFNGFLFSYIKRIVNKSEKMQISNSKYCRARNITKRGRQ